ncbi:MAG: Fe-S cluster assembly ATPase SufC [Chlamydiales bacterium]|nr:Fe-S cluster assembly ATPase SufC [Chlamydiales bacterium]
MLEIKDLCVSVESKPILKGVTLSIQAGEIHAIMGPNGAGKSTLAKVLAGHPAYEVTGGTIYFLGEDLLEMEPEERARLGLFMSFQYPPEITGVATHRFLFQAVKSKQEITEEEFEKMLQEKMEQVQVRKEFRDRDVNEGFSGGEKKKSEILQMAMLDPKLSVLDETDSGLDIDAMRVVAEGVNRLMTPEKSLLLITHYQRLLDYIKPDKIHVLMDGKIVRTEERAFAYELEEKGYDWL